jgi:hypothetical protein
MLLLSFGCLPARAASGPGFEHAIRDAVAVCMPAVIAARMWAQSPDARLRRLPTPSRRAAKLRGGAASIMSRGPMVHPLFEVLYAAAEAKGAATMQYWVRGSAVAKLEPTVTPTEQSIPRGLTFAGWVKRLDASIPDPRAHLDAAVVLNGRHAFMGPDLIAFFSPADVRGSGALPAAVFMQCRRDQTPDTKQTWKESVLSVLDGFVLMGAPAFQLAKCREALGLPTEDMLIFYAPEWRSIFGDRGATSQLRVVDNAADSQTPEAFKLRLALDADAAARGAEALGTAAADARFVVVHCRAASATKDDAAGSRYDLQVERAVRDILKAHAAADGSPHARCFYIRTHAATRGSRPSILRRTAAPF